MLDAAGRLAGTLVEMVHARLALVALDWEEERVRLGRIVACALAALLFAALAVIALVAGVVVYFWDSHRLLALGGVIVVLVLAAAWSLAHMRALVRAKPRLFDATLAELARDRDALARVTGR